MGIDITGEFDAAFLGDEFYNEKVTYTANGCTPVNITAIVYRHGTHTKSGSGMSKTHPWRYSIRVAKQGDNGVSRVTPGLDTVIINMPEVGDTDAVMTAQSIIENTVMCWHLGLKP